MYLNISKTHLYVIWKCQTIRTIRTAWGQMSSTSHIRLCVKFRRAARRWTKSPAPGTHTLISSCESWIFFVACAELRAVVSFKFGTTPFLHFLKRAMYRSAISANGLAWIFSRYVYIKQAIFCMPRSPQSLRKISWSRHVIRFGYENCVWESKNVFRRPYITTQRI